MAVPPHSCGSTDLWENGTAMLDQIMCFWGIFVLFCLLFWNGRRVLSDKWAWSPAYSVSVSFADNSKCHRNVLFSNPLWYLRSQAEKGPLGAGSKTQYWQMELVEALWVWRQCVVACCCWEVWRDWFLSSANVSVFLNYHNMTLFLFFFVFNRSVTRYT